MTIGVWEYDKNSGEPLGHGVYIDEDGIPDDTTDLGYIISDESTVTNKVDIPTGQIVERDDNAAVIDTANINADGVDEATITGIPNPSTVMINDEEQPGDIINGELVFTTDIVGEYFFYIRSFPFKDVEFIINAT